MSARTGHATRARGGRVALLVTILATVQLSTACTGLPTTSESPPSPQGSVEPSDAALDVSRLPVPRTSFCHVLDEPGVVLALDGRVTGTAHYGNGDEIEVRPGQVDVSHEYGCTFEAADGTLARAWVFARPVMSREARTLVRRARRGRDCSFPESVEFGSPGLTSVCQVVGARDAPLVRARLEGLFGDSWLGCEVSQPLARATGSASAEQAGRDVVKRADQWCTEVVTTVGAQP